jgi:hypothetical protein
MRTISWGWNRGEETSPPSPLSETEMGSEEAEREILIWCSMFYLTLDF